MRRCHSDAMQDYRREHNQEMWDRPVADPRILRTAQDFADHNLERRITQAIKLYIEEARIGE